MPPLLEGIIQAFKLIITLDPDLMRIVLLSLQVSGAAIIISTLLGVPLGSFLGLKEERKTRLISKIIFTLMGLPPVVAGLLIYLLLSRQGPLGVLGLLYTPTAMIIAQVCLALPHCHRPDHGGGGPPAGRWRKPPAPWGRAGGWRPGR